MPSLDNIAQYLEDVYAGEITELNEPGQWPIKNALMVIRESMRNFDPDTQANPDSVDYCNGVYMAMSYAVEIIKAINSLKRPEPQDPVEEVRKAQRDLVREMATAYENMADRLREIANGEIIEEMSRW